jgi:hypothetical protein
MKKTAILSILLFVTTAFYVNAQERHATGTGYNNGNGHNSHGNGNGNGNGNGHTGKPGKATVGAPLDGGLLLVLGGAGVAYFAARKKRENL